MKAFVLPALYGFILTFVLISGFYAFSGLRADQTAPDEVSSDTILHGKAQLDPLRITGIEEALLQGKPALSLNFSTPLDAFRSYDKWLSVYDKKNRKIETQWVLSDDALSLYFPEIEARETYRIQVKAGLLAKNGLRLNKGDTLILTANQLQAVVGFFGKGQIIPAGTRAGLPVRSVNVSSIEVDYYRIPVHQFRDLLLYYDTASSEYNSSIVDIVDTAQFVHSTRYDLPEDQNRRVETKLPLDTKITGTAGLYFAVLKRDGIIEYTSPTTYFMVSDIGLHLRQYINQWSVFTSELGSGKANVGVDIRLLDDQGNLLQQATSDEQGQATLPIIDDEARLLLAIKDNHLALLNLAGPALDISEFELPSKRFQQREYFIYGPRDVYRAGEKIQFSALLRDFDGQLLPSVPVVATLIRPNGVVANRQTLTAQKNGYYQFDYTLSHSAPTGQWALQLGLEDDEATSSKAFLVEDFMPEKMRMQFSPKAGAMLSRAKLQGITLHAEYLYGAPAAGNSLSTQITISPARTPFAGLRGFEFGPLTGADPIQRFMLTSGKLNQDGIAHLSLRSDILKAIDDQNGPVKIDYRSSVYESGGRPVERSLQVYSWKNGYWPGIKAGFDTQDNALINQDVSFKLISTAKDGQSVSGRELSVELVKMNRQIHWEYEEGGGWRDEYVDDPKLIWQQDYLSESEPLLIQVPVEKGYYQLSVRDASGNTSSTDFKIGQHWWGYSNDDTTTRPDKINITLDQAAYVAGDMISVQLQSPRPGHGFLIVEDSTGILFSQRISLGEKASVFKIPMPVGEKRWGRHDTRIVALIAQPEQQAKHGVPMRSLGILPVPLDRRDKQIKLRIRAPDKVEPQSTLSLKLSSGQAGENMMVTVSAVDQGVLSITDFETPDPFDFFYQPRLAQVDARDNFSQVLHVKDFAFAKLRSGGDSAELSRAGDRPDPGLRLVSLFKGPIPFDENGEAQVEFDMPDFNGAVRVMVAAFSANKFGAADTEVVVKAPIITQLALPRFAAYGDEAQLTLDIQNSMEQAQDLELNWQLDGVKLVDPARASTRITLASNKKHVIRLPIRVTRAIGNADIRLQVSGHNIRFNRHWSLGLRPAYPAQTFQKQQYLGAQQTSGPDNDWLNAKLAESLQLRLAVSPHPPLNSAEQWRALLRYPYGCLEQTTSRARPLAIANKPLRERWQVTLPEGLDRVEAVQNAINRLQTMQRTDGSFGLWSLHSPEEHWLTAYVSEFLLSARDKGFQVPQAMLDNAITRLQHYVSNTRLSTRGRHYGDQQHYYFAFRSYAAFVLSRLGKAPLGSLRNWFDGYSNQSKSPLPLAHLAIALKRQGDGVRAEKAMQLAANTRRSKDTYLGDYGSVIRDSALLLMLNQQYGLGLSDTEQRLVVLSELIYRRSYLSTQERDAILQLALALESSEQTTAWSARLKLGAGTKTITSAGNWSEVIRGAAVADTSIEVSSDKKVFVSQTLIAHPLQAPEKQFDGFSIQRDWFDSSGNAITSHEFKTGDYVIVRLSVTADRRSPDALIVDLLPAGFELENPGLKHATPLSSFSIDGRVLQEVKDPQSAQLKHSEYRDDRYLAAVDLRKGSTLVLTYLMRAVTPGRYQVPSAFVEDMYRPEYRAVGVPFSGVSIEAEF